MTKNEDGQCSVTAVSSKSDAIDGDNQYLLNRVYHTKTFDDGNNFHRRIIYISDKRGDIVNNVALVQYCFDRDERNFNLQPHGNSRKDGAQGFTRTQPSTVTALKEKCAMLGPREAIRQTKGACGGVTEVESPAQMPRGVRQAKYVRKAAASSQQRFGEEDNDEMLSVLYRMKEEDNSFIRDISIGREGLSIVLASDAQLAEMEKFCTEEMMFAVMQIDPTFNLGPYECTPISYKNLLLERKSTGKPLVFVGPVLIHYKKDERTYKDFLNKLKSLKPGLKDVISFGTDGEMALVNALHSCFPKGAQTSLRCFRHFRQNVEAMLHKAGIRGIKANQYIWEVFGKVSSDGSYEAGLLDSESELTFLSSSTLWRPKVPKTESRPRNKGRLLASWAQLKQFAQLTLSNRRISLLLLQACTKIFSSARNLRSSSALTFWNYRAEKGTSTYPGFTATALESY